MIVNIYFCVIKKVTIPVPTIQTVKGRVVFSASGKSPP